MQRNQTRLTTSQFAELHNVNKRTLHYYDSIGLFSPDEKGENDYRYYNISQSIDFEYIRMLKDLNMSIKEIALYWENPTSDKFIQIAEAKERELTAQIQNLKHTKEALHRMKSRLNFCRTLRDGEIRLVECPEEKLLVLPYDFTDNDVTDAFSYAKEAWSIEQIRMGIGGYISVNKVLNADFEKYDGIFTPALKKTSGQTAITRPKGIYLCGYLKGDWDKLPSMYEKMTAYAADNHLQMTGYAYEMGLNEFAISSQEDYVTEIMIQVV